jgi:hypothetical protein
MRKITGRRGWTVLVLVLAAPLAACSPEDDTHGGDGGRCNASACMSACLGEGLGPGTCRSDACICEDTDAGPPTDGDDGGGGDVPRRVTRMRGKVWSPGGVVPISGALVYFTMTEPPPIPPGAYPDACVDPPGSFFIRSNPDGTFELDVVPGAYRLVTQKGQFRRVRDITVPDSDTPIDIDFELTTLPARTDEAVGDTIPHIALVWALDGGDHIEDVLAKLTMGDLSGDRLARGSEPFDIYNIAPYEPNTALLESRDRMLSYHIIFFPCTIDGGEQLNDPTAPLSNPAVLDNLRAFATAGGKIYATDMMYDIFEQPMPVYVDICGDDNVLNAGDQEAWRTRRR